MAALLTLLAASAWRSAPSTRAPLRIHLTRRPLLVACTASPAVPASAAPPAPAGGSEGPEPLVDVLAWLDERVQTALVESYGPEFASTPTLHSQASLGCGTLRHSAKLHPKFAHSRAAANSAARSSCWKAVRLAKLREAAEGLQRGLGARADQA